MISTLTYLLSSAWPIISLDDKLLSWDFSWPTSSTEALDSSKKIAPQRLSQLSFLTAARQSTTFKTAIILFSPPTTLPLSTSLTNPEISLHSQNLVLFPAKLKESPHPRPTFGSPHLTPGVMAAPWDNTSSQMAFYHSPLLAYWKSLPLFHPLGGTSLPKCSSRTHHSTPCHDSDRQKQQAAPTFPHGLGCLTTRGGHSNTGLL